MKRILITAPIRQDPEVLKQYLDSIYRQEQGNFVVDKYFILHNCFKTLKEYFPTDCILLEYNDKTTCVKGEFTHNWYQDNFKAIVKMKNEIVAYALNEKYDYIFWVDSDLILHPKTLNHLFNILETSNQKVCSEIFWTEWNKGHKETIGSNGWDYDAYGGDQERFKKPGIYQIGGTGACILVNISVYGYNVNYSPIYNVSFTEWEDRAFCVRLAVNNIKIFMDTHYPATHLYR
jgi:hypothetical protein